MNNDLISRSELKETINSTISQATKIGITADANYLWELLNYAIDNAPTVDINDAKYLEERDADAYETGYLQGHIEGYQKAEKDYARPIGEWIDEGQYAEGHSEHAYLCKNCGYQIIELPNMIFENRFCKYCGADMQKEGAE